MAPVEGLCKNFFYSRRMANVKAYEELWGDKKPWGVTESGLFKLNNAFQYVLNGENIEDILRKRKKRFDHTFAFDVMGQGGFFPEVNLDGGLALALSGQPPTNLKLKALYDHTSPFQLIGGDVLKGATWTRTNSYLKAHTGHMNGGFDLVICRPVAGWEVIGYYQDELEHIILSKLLSVTSPLDGRLLMEMSCTTSFRQDWLSEMKQVPEITITAYNSSISIIKHQEIKSVPKIQTDPSFRKPTRYIEF